MRGDRPIAITKGISGEESLIFFGQRLEELSSPASLDSYRAPTVNIPALLEEAVGQADLVMSGSNGVPSSSLSPIVEELISRLSGNIVSNSIVSPDREIVNRLTSLSGEELHGILLQLKQEISGWAYATQAMELAIQLLSTKKKKDIDFVATEIVTTLVNLSMSRRYIHESVLSFFWSKKDSINDIEDIRSFFGLVFPHGHKFNICFRVTQEIDALHATSFPSLGVNVLKVIPQPFALCEREMGINTIDKSNRFIVISDIMALDRHSAIIKAQSRLSLLKNLYRMYNHDNSFLLFDEVALEQCCDTGVKVVRSEGYVPRAVSDSSDRLASRKLSNILNNSHFLKGKHYEKFVSVSEFHGFSMDSESLPNKLLNTWISLETICPSKRGSSKIDSVISGVLPCVGLRYLDRIFSSMISDLSSWSRTKAGPIMDRASDVGAQKKLQLLALCTQPARLPDLEELLKVLDDHALLRSRVYRMHLAVSAPGGINAMLEKHSERVAWQLRRIYRARNSIVHVGSVPPYIAALSDSAHDYFDQLLGMIGEISCGPNGFSDFDAAFSFLDWEFTTYKKMMAKLDYADNAVLSSLFWKRRPSVSRYAVLKAGPKGT